MIADFPRSNKPMKSPPLQRNTYSCAEFWQSSELGYHIGVRRQAVLWYVALFSLLSRSQVRL
jgi:hypothetical protein